MTAVTAVARAAATALPLTLLSLGLVFVIVVAMLRPTLERQAMVDRLGCAIKDLGTVIAGRVDPETKGLSVRPG